MNQFDNTGFAVRLPKLTEGTYGALVRAKDQLRQSKQFQQKQIADAEEFNYRVFKDLSDVNFKDLDGIHKQAMSGLTKGYLEKVFDEYNTANKEGRRVSPISSAKEKQTLLSANDRMLAHQQELAELNRLTKEKQGWYNEQLGIDALKTVFKTGEDGKVITDMPNLDSPTGSVLALMQNPKYINVDKALGDIFDGMGKTAVTKFGTFKDDKTGQFFDKEEDFELINIYGAGKPETDEEGRPIPQASKETLSWLYANQPQVHAAFVDEAKANDLEPLAYLQNQIDAKYKGTSKGANFSKVTIPNSTTDVSSAFESASVELNLPQEDAIRTGISSVSGKKWSTPDLARGIQINNGEQIIEADFQGIEPSNNGSYSFVFSRLEDPTMEEVKRNPLQQDKKVRRYEVPITDEETVKKLRNALSKADRTRFNKSLEEAKSNPPKATKNSQEIEKAKESLLTGTIKKISSGNYEEAVKTLESLGLTNGEDFEIKGKSWWESSSSRKIVVNGKEFSVDDPKLPNAISEAIKPELKF